MSDTPAVEFQNVSKEYWLGLLRRRRVQAVSNISFQIRRGEVLGLLGPNRAGKTTLIKLLLSLCRPTSGQIQRLGEPVSRRHTLGQVGYVHENHAFPRYLTATGLLEYYGALTLVPHEKIQARVPALLEQVGLADRKGDILATFSKGMIQRIGLAQALINEPQLLVLDEPNEGLDLLGRQMVAQAIRQLRSRGGSVVLVSHVLGEVEQLCDRVAVLYDGKLAYLGTIPELIQRSGSGPRTLEHSLQAIYQKAAT